MKADIPDKILINRGEDGRLHHSYWTTDQELVPFEDTLYIRKDALIEWVEEKLSKNLKEIAGEWAENEAYGKSDAEFEMAYKGFKAGAKWAMQQLKGEQK